MAEHQELTAASGTTVYFCDPANPRQRGSNENTNRLLRQYLAKNADLRALTQRDLDEIAARINGRPRRVLGWDSVADRYRRVLGASSVRARVPDSRSPSETACGRRPLPRREPRDER